MRGVLTGQHSSSRGLQEHPGKGEQRGGLVQGPLPTTAPGRRTPYPAVTSATRGTGSSPRRWDKATVWRSPAACLMSVTSCMAQKRYCCSSEAAEPSSPGHRSHFSGSP